MNNKIDILLVLLLLVMLCSIELVVKFIFLDKFIFTGQKMYTYNLHSHFIIILNNNNRYFVPGGSNPTEGGRYCFGEQLKYWSHVVNRRHGKEYLLIKYKALGISMMNEFSLNYNVHVIYNDKNYNGVQIK